MNFILSTNTITAYLSLETFRFESQGKSCVVGTHLLLETTNGKQTIASIGESRLVAGNQVRVDLFKGNEPFDKFDHLVAVLQYGLIGVTRKWAIIRPTIICYGAASLRAVFNGYEEGVLNRAFGDAGAMQIFFK